MKNISFKLILLIACVFALNSFVTAVNVYPSFNFEFKDGTTPPPGGWTYTVYYRIQNSAGVFFPTTPPGWLVNTGPYSQGINYSFTDVMRVVYPPSPPNPVRCYRIEVVVFRNEDGAYRGGWSEWTDESGLQLGTLQINVNPF